MLDRTQLIKCHSIPNFDIRDLHDVTLRYKNGESYKTYFQRATCLWKAFISDYATWAIKAKDFHLVVKFVFHCRRMKNAYITLRTVSYGRYDSLGREWTVRLVLANKTEVLWTQYISLTSVFMFNNALKSMLYLLLTFVLPGKWQWIHEPLLSMNGVEYQCCLKTLWVSFSTGA